jgi:ankyrin repeat protein
MTERKIPRALVLTGIVLDVLIVLVFLFMPRSGMETLGAVFLLYPLVAIRLVVVIIALVLSVRRRNWQLGLYTVLAIAVLGWFWMVGASLNPTWEPLHRVLRMEAKALAIRVDDYLAKRAYDAKRARQHQQNPKHGTLCDLLSVERDLQALDTVLDQDLNRPCATYDGDEVSPLLHAVIHTYGFWTGDMRAHPPKDEAFLGPAAERLLAAGADPDAQDAFGNTALHYGLTFQNAGLVDALLSHGACILLKNGLDESPLSNHSSHRLRKKVEAAATNPTMLANCPEHLRGLTGREADDNKTVPDDLQTPDAGLLGALRSGRLERAIHYLEQGADPDAGDHEGSSFEAALRNCRDNALSLAQLLLDAGADINGQNRRGESALMISMRYCVDAVPFLLESGADPTLGDRKGDTPLHQLGGVAPERLNGIVDLLIASGADINQQTRSGQTPLIRSLFGGTARTRVSSALLERGTDLNLTDNAGNSVLHILAGRKRDEGAPALMATLIGHGAAVELQNRKQQTPLVTAVEQGSPEVVQVLIEAGAEVNVRKARGNTLISGLIFCKPEKLAKLELLVDAGADISIPIEHGPLPLEQAFFGKIYLDCLEPAQILLDAGADPNQQNDNGAAAIHSIATWVEKDPEAALTLLREHGADIDLRNQQGMTALLLAARYGTSIRTLERLLAHGADPNARDDKGNTLLHAAAMNSKDGNLARYDWVLAIGGNPESRNKAGQTPLDRARITGNDTLAESIESRKVDRFGL